MFFKKKKAVDWLNKEIDSKPIAGGGLDSIVSQVYVKELALYTAVGLLADIIAGCERQVFRDGETVHDNIWYRLNVSANTNQAADQMIAQWVMNLYYRGHSLIVPLSGSLYVADSYHMEEYPLKGNHFRNVQVENLQLRRNFRADEVYYISQGNREIKRLIDGIFEGYAQLIDCAKDSYIKGSGEKYALNIGKPPSGDEDTQQAYLSKLRDNLTMFAKAANAAYPLTKEQDLKKLRDSAASSNYAGDVTALRKEVYAIVASALHFPASLLDGTMTNTDQIIDQMLTFAVGPLAHKISIELTRKTFSQEEIAAGSRINVDTTAIRHVDAVEMADKLDKLISSGIMCIDEVRRRCNMPELNTEWSRKHYITKNYGDLENALDPLEGGKSS